MNRRRAPAAARPEFDALARNSSFSIGFLLQTQFDLPVPANSDLPAETPGRCSPGATSAGAGRGFFAEGGRIIRRQQSGGYRGGRCRCAAISRRYRGSISGRSPDPSPRPVRPAHEQLARIGPGVFAVGPPGGIFIGSWAKARPARAGPRSVAARHGPSALGGSWNEMLPAAPCALVRVDPQALGGKNHRVVPLACSTPLGAPGAGSTESRPP